MGEKHFEALIRLYILGKNVKSMAKKHNYDQISRAFVLWRLQQAQSSISELATLLGIKPSAMSEKISQMEKLGLVEQVKSTDKRKREFKVSKKGRSFWKLTKQKVVNKHNQSNLGLSDLEVTQLLGLLKKIKVESI